MVKLKDLPPQPPSILMHGDAGTGKTAFGTSGGKFVQVVDVDNGIKTARTFKDGFFDKRQEIDVVECWETSPKSPKSFEKVCRHITKVEQDVKSGKWPFKVLFIDSLTSLCESCMERVLANSNRLGQAPQIQHWGMYSIMMQHLLAHFKSLPIVKILSAHVERHEEDGEIIRTISVLGQKLVPKIPTYFDEVWSLEIRNVAGGKTKHLIRTQGTTSKMARTRGNLENLTDTSLGLEVVLDKLGYKLGD